MIAAGVPCVPGYEGADQDVATLMEEAARIGFPVMIKAAAGGGGRGMRLVAEADDFADALALARSEAMGAFGSGEVILEKAVIRPRHVEIQVFADAHGAVVHLGERDCSVQRRHQKVIEEAPCPVMTPDLRAAMGAAAVAAAGAIGYRGAGTVEFLLDDTGAFHFLEMNTRLQVEHPVTEMVTGRDLVALQFAVARGAPLGFAQEDVSLTGHAIEARLYAEDPGNDFLPSAGPVHRWRPAIGDGVRVDAGIAEGQAVSPFYDPMLAKIVAHGATRDEARRRLVAALRDTVLFGPATNRDFLIEALGKPAFVAGEATTAFIGDAFGDAPAVAPGFADIAAVAATIHQDNTRRALERAVNVSPELAGWGSPGALHSRLRLTDDDTRHVLTITQGRDGALTISDGDCTAIVTTDPLRVDGRRVDLRGFHRDGDDVFFATGARVMRFRIDRAGDIARAGGGGTVAAPMHGNLLQVFVRDGDSVQAGDRLAVLEAMKMQHELIAEVAGRVRFAAVPAQVQAGDVLVEIETEDP